MMVCLQAYRRVALTVSNSWLHELLEYVRPRVRIANMIIQPFGGKARSSLHVQEASHLRDIVPCEC